MSVAVHNHFEESVIKNEDLPFDWQEQCALDDLAEFLQFNWEQRSVFYDDREVTSQQKFITFLGQKSLRTNNYIGTIVFNGNQFNIFPKVFMESDVDSNTEKLDMKHLMKSLVHWLVYCTRIDYPFINMSADLNDCQDLRELFVTLYLHYVKRAIEQLPFYRYEDKTEDISVIKGSIDFKDYINNKIPNGLHNKFSCTYSEFEFDNIVNRIIKYTCKCILDYTALESNKRIIRQILMRLNDVTDIRCTPIDCDGIKLSKFHQKYSVLVSMSKMFLLNQSFAYQVNEQDSFCFLFPTELLFEGFIGGYIKSALTGTASVKFQVSDMTLVDELKYGPQSFGKLFVMRHDILVDHKEKGLFILDTKYKMISRFETSEDIKESLKEEISQSDLYQMVSYAVKRGVSDVYLLYPLFRSEENEPVFPVATINLNSGSQIRIHLVRLPFVFEEDIETTKINLTNCIEKMF